MAFRDSWHRTLVYFGLAEERDPYVDEDEPYEPEAELEDRYRERPNVRRLGSRRRRDEFDDIFADDDVPDRDLGLHALADHAGGAWLQPDQGANRLTGASLGPGLQQTAEEDQGEDDANGLEVHPAGFSRQDARQERGD